MTYVEWVNAVIDCAARAANDRRRQELEQLERLERAEAERDPRRPGVFAPGDVITYAAKHLQLAYVELVPIDDAASCSRCARVTVICARSASTCVRLIGSPTTAATDTCIVVWCGITARRTPRRSRSRR